MRCRAALAVLLCGLLSAGARAAPIGCEQAAAIAEHSAALPDGLLLAIGAVESGRTDATGRQIPWPWTIQGGGVGRFFASAEEAVAAVETMREEGVQSIDIGCFQMNLFYHPEAFADLASGFDPLTNAMAAARFLNELHDELGSWEQAVSAYHSRTDSLGNAYRAQVYAAWRNPSADRPRAAKPIPIQFGVHVWGPTGQQSAMAAPAWLPRVIIPGNDRKLSFY